MLNIYDNVMREVIDESCVHDVCNRFHALYVRKDLPNKIFLRERLFSFKMNATKTMDENLDEFKKLTSKSWVVRVKQPF